MVTHISYSEKRNAPSVIKLWFRKTPIVFMAISAVTFIVGLNLFAYSSHQVCIDFSAWILTNSCTYQLANLCCNYPECIHRVSHLQSTHCHIMVCCTTELASSLLSYDTEENISVRLYFSLRALPVYHLYPCAGFFNFTKECIHPTWRLPS